MQSQETSECLRRLLRGKELETCAVYRFTLVPYLLYVDFGYNDRIVLEGLIDGYVWRPQRSCNGYTWRQPWPKITFHWRPSYH